MPSGSPTAGYACLQVNYRGSTGYGKGVPERGQQAVGQDDARRPHRRLRVGRRSRGTPIRDKIAIFGGSYGGYAALAGVTFTPDYFACAVDIVGPSNLRTLVESIPPYWKPMRSTFDIRMGNIDDPADAELIRRGPPAVQGGEDRAGRC